MIATRQDWNRFWTDHTADNLPRGADPRTWSGMVWRVGLEELADLFQRLAPGKKMLECGCGRATVSRFMALRGYDCTMLDYSSQAIDLAKASFADDSLQGEFVLGDMNKLPFADNQFDVVYSGGVLEFFSDIAHPLREIVRVLKPGGLCAVNIVPNKFSCQTLADLERTLAHSLKCLFTLRWRDAFVRLNHLPPGVSRARLKSYVSAFEHAGLRGVTGYGVSPFPALALGRGGERVYVRLMEAFRPQWRRFNRSGSAWAEIWGMAYMVYGIKPKD